jgi:hypothetical protein
MELSQLETQILIDLYDADVTAGDSIDINKLQLTEKNPRVKPQEFAFYLGKLKGLKLIAYDEKEAFCYGGFRNLNYKNNVALVCGDKIHILGCPKGMKIVEEAIKRQLFRDSKKKA